MNVLSRMGNSMIDPQRATNRRDWLAACIRGGTAAAIVGGSALLVSRGALCAEGCAGCGALAGCGLAPAAAYRELQRGEDRGKDRGEDRGKDCGEDKAANGSRQDGR